MKIGAISYQTTPHFTGENNKKSNSLRNVAGAAAIALATALPTEEANAQIFYPPVYPIYSPYPTYNYIPEPKTTVPHCFVFGDTRYDDSDKSYKQMFDEIDANGNENGLISAKEVIRTERNNWNRDNLLPFNTNQMTQTERQFNQLSRLYNEDNSDPKTMNYREYKAVMKDFSDDSPAENIRNFLNILTTPYLYTPYYHYIPHHHHHHHHRPTPPHHHHRH